MKGLALLLGKPKGGDAMDDDDEAPPSSRDGGSSADAYASELADMCGVDPADRKAFAKALKGYVMACQDEG